MMSDAEPNFYESMGISRGVGICLNIVMIGGAIGGLLALFGWPFIGLPIASIALMFLFAAYILERQNRGGPPPELESMELVSEDLGTLTISSGVLAIPDQWNLSGGLRIKGVPDELLVRIRRREKDEWRILASLQLSGGQGASESGSDVAAVDTGLLFFGDAAIFDYGVSAKDLESISQAGFSKSGPVQERVVDPQGICRGVICETGFGDGVYPVKWISGGSWRLQCKFFEINLGFT